MPGRALRIVAGIAWVVGSLAAWAGVCNVFTGAWMYFQNERGVRFPGWLTDVYNWTAVGGIVLIPAVVAVLAIRAYLPGTGQRPSKRRGFAVENAGTSGRA